MKKLVILFVLVVFATLTLYGQSTPMDKYIGLSGYIEVAFAPVTVPKDLRFSIWKDESSNAGSDKVWEEVHNGVAFTDGEFSVFLGETVDLVNNATWPNLNWSLDIQYWIQIEHKTVGAPDSGYATFLPRKKYLSVPHAFGAGQIEVLPADPANPQTGQMWLVVP